MNRLSNPKTKVIVILGPTSSGKSDVAIMLAKKFDGEVISADSRQIYRDMNLGTGKVEGEWQKKNKRKVFVSEQVVHHLLDFRSPRGNYNVSHFQENCGTLINEISARKKLPIICGGTGFWIDAVVNGVVLPQVKPDHVLRKKLEKQTTKQLHTQLKKLDSSRSKTIDSKNKQRLVRAIEICKAIGSVPRIDRTETTK
ncbi:MAG: isopentenyl transferase family protein [Patescibacteria group bacterium]|nr:isopentenyl transferase family protein [Patescibacteria group bacterium]